MQAKLNQPLIGITCINKNNQTQQKFKNILTKVYKIVAEQEKSIVNNDTIEHIQTLEELQSKFDDGILEYIDNTDPKIPGITEKGTIKK